MTTGPHADLDVSQGSEGPSRVLDVSQGSEGPSRVALVLEREDDGEWKITGIQ